ARRGNLLRPSRGSIRRTSLDGGGSRTPVACGRQGETLSGSGRPRHGLSRGGSMDRLETLNNGKLSYARYHKGYLTLAPFVPPISPDLLHPRRLRAKGPDRKGSRPDASP